MNHLQYIHPEKKDFTILTDPSRLDIDFIHQFLTDESYWAKGAEQQDTADLLDGELCFGVFHKKEQVGFASVTSDYSSYAYISDVFIQKKHEKQGLALWLLECVISHPQLQNLPNWMLLTDDAHGLYEKIGFERVPGSEDQMIRYNH